MKENNFQLLPISLMARYTAARDNSLMQQFEALQDSELSIDHFSFYISVSAVYSSKTEGENIELDSYIKHKRLGVKYKSEYVCKTDDLYEAFLFAQKNELNPTTINKAHTLLAKNLLQSSGHGSFRKNKINVVIRDGKIEYVAAAPDLLIPETTKFYADLEFLLNTELTFHEVFFFASLLHLVFVKIHPFEDGNGRTSRLIEKWFLAQKLGEKAWFIESERYYYEQHAAYYSAICRLGLEYETLNYDEALPFLQLLPRSLMK